MNLGFRAQGLVAPQAPVKQRHGSRGYLIEEPHTSENSTTKNATDRLLPLHGSRGYPKMEPQTLEFHSNDENSDESVGDGQLLDVGNPLHVALLEFGLENLIPHAGSFFTRMHNYEPQDMDMEIMKVINHKIALDGHFGDWVREKMHRETLKQEKVLLLEGRGVIPDPPVTTLGKMPQEFPFGHSDVDPRGGDTHCTTLMTRVPPRVENTPVKKIPLTLI